MGLFKLFCIFCQFLILLADFGKYLQAYIPVAPVGTEKYTIQQYQSVKVPTFVVYGKKISILYICKNCNYLCVTRNLDIIFKASFVLFLAHHYELEQGRMFIFFGHICSLYSLKGVHCSHFKWFD